MCWCRAQARDLEIRFVLSTAVFPRKSAVANCPKMFTFKRLVSAVIMIGGSQVRVLQSPSEVIDGCAIKPFYTNLSVNK